MTLSFSTQTTLESKCLIWANKEERPLQNCLIMTQKCPFSRQPLLSKSYHTDYALNWNTVKLWESDLTQKNSVNNHNYKLMYGWADLWALTINRLRGCKWIKNTFFCYSNYWIERGKLRVSLFLKVSYRG